MTTGVPMLFSSTLCRTRGPIWRNQACAGWSTVTAVAVAAHRPDCVTRTCSPAG